MHLQEEDTPKLCRVLDVANKYESVGFWCFLGIASLLFVYCVFRLVKLRRLRISKDVQFIHFLLLFWTIITMTNCLISNIAYLKIVDLGEQYPYSEYPPYLKSVLPRLALLADTSAAILLHTILLIVPYYWIESILYYMENSSGGDGLSFVKRFNKVIRFYVWITRIAFIGALIIELFLEEEDVLKTFRIVKIAIVAESFIIMFVVGYGCRVLLKYFHSLAALTEDSEDTRMKIQSSLLIFSCFARLVLDVLSLIPTIGKELRQYSSDCIENPANFDYLILIVLVFTLMNFAPTIILLVLYTPRVDDGDNPLTRSMVSSSMVAGSDSEQ